MAKQYRYDAYDIVLDGLRISLTKEDLENIKRFKDLPFCEENTRLYSEELAKIIMKKIIMLKNMVINNVKA